MMTRAIASLLLVLLAATAGARGEGKDTYQNPLDVIIADPFVMKDKGTYYLYGTTVAYYGFQVYSSQNLVDWRNHGFVLNRTDTSWARNKFWAPECFEHKGKYYFHYTAQGRETSLRVHLAVGDSPLGPFKDVKTPWFEIGQAVIDSHVFKDDDGQLYLYYVVDCSENKFSEIRVCRLSDDLVPAEKESAFCTRPSQEWEGDVWNEGPLVVKRGKTYYLMYSGNAFFDQHYGLGYATAESPMGPWKKYEKNPILQKAPGAAGPGHNGMAESPDGSELFAVYHTLQNPGFNAARQLAVDRVRWEKTADGGADVMVIDGPTADERPIPAGARALVRGKSDEFDGPELNRTVWTVFNENPRRYEIKDGRVVITTTDGDIAERRDDQDNLFLQYAPREGDFEVTTRVAITPAVDFQNAFLCLWQDHDNFVKLAVVHDQKPRIEVAVETDAVYKKQLFENELGGEAYLKVARKGDRYVMSVSGDGKLWKVLVGDVPAKLTDLRVGFGAASPGTREGTTAGFDYFRFTVP